MAKKPRHGLRPQAKSPSAPPSLRNGASKDRPAVTRRKSRFEQLEDRRVLTALFTRATSLSSRSTRTAISRRPRARPAPSFSPNTATIGVQSTPVQQVALPTAVSGSNQPSYAQRHGRVGRMRFRSLPTEPIWLSVGMTRPPAAQLKATRRSVWSTPMATSTPPPRLRC